MGFIVIDPPPTQAPVADKNGSMANVWQLWYGKLRDNLRDGDFALPQPYTKLIHITGGKGVGLFSDVNVKSAPNQIDFAVVSRIISSTVVPQGAQIVAYYGQTIASQGGSGNGEMWGAAWELINGTLTSGSKNGITMVGQEIAVINQFDNNVASLVGINLVFGNRILGMTSPFNGLGANKYNFNSRAIYISSEPRSGAGEFCGWSSGIFFELNSMDNPLGGGAIGIDMSRVPQVRMPIGLWMQDSVEIVMSTAQTTCELKYDPGQGKWGLSNAGVGKFGVDMTSGQITDFSPTATTIGAAGGAAALPATPLGYFIHLTAGGTTVKIPYYNP